MMLRSCISVNQWKFVSPVLRRSGLLSKLRQHQRVLGSHFFSHNEISQSILRRFSTASNVQYSPRVPVESLPPEERGRYKIVTVPNVICLTRIAATPLIGYLVVNHQFCPAFFLFVAAGFTDMLDGFIARNVPGQKSLLGSVLDPVSDKLLVSVMFVTMAHASLLPVPLAAVVILRDVLLIVGGFYKRFQTMEPPYTLNRYFNPEVSSMQVVPTTVSKINTLLQLSVVASALASPVFQFGDAGVLAITGLGWVTAATTIYSGWQYMGGKALKKV